MTLTADHFHNLVGLIFLAAIVASYKAGDAVGFHRGLCRGRRRGALAVRRFRRGRRRLIARAAYISLCSGARIERQLLEGAGRQSSAHLN